MLRRARLAAPALIAIAAALFAVAALPFRGRGRLQDPGPVELDVRVVLFEQADGRFVDRRAADAHAGRRAEPVQQPLAAPAPAGLGQGRRFIAAPIAVEAELWQGYFLLAVFGLALAAAADFFLVGVAGAFAAGAFLALAGAGFAAGRLTAAFGGAAGFGCGAAGLGAATVSRWTSVNRVWSPIE